MRETRQTDIRMSAPSSPTQDNVKMDTGVQASLSLPATPLGKGLDNAFDNSTGIVVSCLPSPVSNAINALKGTKHHI